MKIEVIKLDNLGRGIGYLDKKIVFIEKSVPGDIVLVDIIENKKNYSVARIKEILIPSKRRIKPICPYFDKFGGCDLMQITISDALDYKLDKVQELLTKNNNL